MKKINPTMLVFIILVGGFFAFKIMSFLGCYVRIEDVNECWKLTAWQNIFIDGAPARNRTADLLITNRES